MASRERERRRILLVDDEEVLASSLATRLATVRPHFLLPDVVQLYVLSNTTGRLDIRHHSGDGQVWFEHGTIRHAVTARGKGEEAFFEIMMWSGGEFSMRRGDVTQELSITSDWQELLMESFRRLDERNRGEETGTGRTGWTQAPPPADDLEDLFGGLDVEHALLPQPTIAVPSEAESLEPTMNVEDSLAKLNVIE
ncbi:DUF4388 domain-containing protein [Labilithrix luteola]|nr:DUF4388 domain-containing protein [Labilithrix luteola]